MYGFYQRVFERGLMYRLFEYCVIGLHVGFVENLCHRIDVWDLSSGLRERVVPSSDVLYHPSPTTLPPLAP